MSSNYKPSNPYIITNWGNILLDTTFVIRVINFAKNQKEDNRLCYELMAYLSSNKYQVTASKSDERSFYISAITVAEILGRYEDTVEKSKVIAQSLNANNITIIDFDEDSANIFNTKFCEKLGKKHQDDILKRWGENNSKDHRQAINNDLMILASGISNGIDTVICVDKGMYRIAKELGFNVIYVKEKYFNRSGNNFFTFDAIKADDDLLIKPKKRYKDLDVILNNEEE